MPGMWEERDEVVVVSEAMLCGHGPQRSDQGGELCGRGPQCSGQRCCAGVAPSVVASEPRCAGVAPSVSEVVSHRVA